MIEIFDKGTWVQITDDDAIHAVEKGDMMCRTHPIEGTAIVQILKGYGNRQQEVISGPWQQFNCRGETVEETLEKIMARIVASPFTLSHA